MGIILKEHISCKLTLSEDAGIVASNKSLYLLRQPGSKIKPRVFKIERKQEHLCFECKVADTVVELRSGYYVGIDWLTQDRYVHVEPKLNTAVADIFEKISSSPDDNPSDEDIEAWDKNAVDDIQKGDAHVEVDIISMLMELMSHAEVAQHTGNLLLVDWEAPEITINQKQDLLTPFLVVRFLKLLQDIVRKGLKKSYYKVQENLHNRVKGKILVGQQIKQNIFRNRLTNTVCTYQVFGEDSIENRFLKKVFLFCSQYIGNNTGYFKKHDNITWLINYIRPSLEHISTEVDVQDIKHLKHNPFFKEYKEAIKAGQQILKRFSYNITKATAEQLSTPPFWIDMPKMFELYVYKRLLNDNPGLVVSHFNYQFSTHGNVLDFLICTGNIKIVVDAKYKMHYHYGQVHNDIRQVAGYARLKKVREKLKVQDDRNIDCLIIYPDLTLTDFNYVLDDMLNASTPILAYHKVYKLGVPLPLK